MASPQASDKLSSELKVIPYDFDPDSADATDVGWINFRDYKRVMVMIIRRVGTGAIDGFKLLANTTATGSGTDVEIKTHAVGSEPDAVNDFLVLECTEQEIAQEGSDNDKSLIGFSAQVELATSTDELVVLYILEPKYPSDGQTADTIA